MRTSNAVHYENNMQLHHDLLAPHCGSCALKFDVDFPERILMHNQLFIAMRKAVLWLSKPVLLSQILAKVLSLTAIVKKL